MKNIQWPGTVWGDQCRHKEGFCMFAPKEAVKVVLPTTRADHIHNVRLFLNTPGFMGIEAEAKRSAAHKALTTLEFGK